MIDNEWKAELDEALAIAKRYADFIADDMPEGVRPPQPSQLGDALLIVVAAIGMAEREEVAQEIRRIVGNDLSRAQCSNLADAILSIRPAPTDGVREALELAYRWIDPNGDPVADSSGEVLAVIKATLASLPAKSVGDVK